MKEYATLRVTNIRDFYGDVGFSTRITGYASPSDDVSVLQDLLHKGWAVISSAIIAPGDGGQRFVFILEREIP